MRRRLVIAAQIALALAVVWFAVAKLARQWGDVKARAAALDPQWGLVLASCGIVLLTYALLIETWRTVVAGWGSRLGYLDAARIWTISNLGRYVPGKVWQLGTMAWMARERGVSGTVAAGSALVVTVVNLVAGFVVAAATGADVLGIPGWGVAVIGAVAAATLLAPSVLPRIIALAARATGRTVVVPRLPTRSVAIAAVASAVAWVLYGLAFMLLARGVLRVATGDPSLYVAVFTGSYLIGFLALFAPGGLGPREAAMYIALEKAGFDVGSATILVVTSRLWLTVLEILPALLFLAHLGVRRPPPHALEEPPPT